jgi:hypothetical protein
MVNPNQKEFISSDRADELEKNEEKGKVPSEIILNDDTKSNANITNIDDDEYDDSFDIVAIAREIEE